MKKTFIYAFLGAIALSGATGFTSCSDKEELAADNPGYNPKTGEVPVGLVFRVSTGVSSSTRTRMTAANTQADLSQKFRGIDNAFLLATKLGTGNDGKIITKSGDFTSTTGEGTSAVTSINSKLFNLGNLMSAEEITQATDATNKTSHRIIELSLPTETNGLLFWGKAKKSTDANANHEQGKADFSIPADMNIDNMQIKLARVVPNDGDEPSNPFRYAALEQYEAMLAAVLTKIIRSEATWIEGTGDAAVSHSMAWVDYVEEVTVESKTKLRTKEKDPASTVEPKNNMSNLGEVLGDAFCTFNTIYENELRAGSGKTIVDVLTDLDAVVDKVRLAKAINSDEEVAVKVAAAIHNNIGSFCENGAWRLPNDVVANCGISEPATNLSLIQQPSTLHSDYILENFPAFFHLPKGATILEIKKETYPTESSAEGYDPAKVGQDKTDARGNKLYYYQYKGAIDTYSMGGSSTAGSGNTQFNPRNYMYPPELCYFGNSPVRVTDDTHSASDYPEGPSDWVNNDSWDAGKTGTNSKKWTSPGHVLSTTRSVAMRDNINYGTALLQTTVHYATDKLEDNNAAIQLRNTGATEANNVIDVSTGANLFQLTGILVGGQEPIVGWNYIPVGTEFGSMVYDRLTNAISIPQAAAGSGGGQTAPNYTLVWDNWEKANEEADQRTVYIALEFVNNSGINFWGQNNLIRKGETFYITGKLDPDVTSAANLTALGKTADEFKGDKSLGITWPTNYALPPYDNSGNTIKKRRVFIQDYKTIANFTISAQSLQHALVAVPDLRSAQISLGLSVDLSWEQGLTFDDIELGK